MSATSSSILADKAGMLAELKTHIDAQAKSVTSSAIVHGELTLEARRGEVAELVKFLRDDSQCRFETLVDVCGCDFPERDERFDVVYHLLSMRLNQRVRVKVRAGENDLVPSITQVHPSANWFERETFDMYGVLFSGHPDLRRILTDYGFDGYPLRKDFPLTGHVELRYDESQKRVVYEPVKLVQEFRNFDFESPWEGMMAGLPGDEKAGGKP